MIRGKRAQKGVKPIRNPSYVDALGASKKQEKGVAMAVAATVADTDAPIYVHRTYIGNS